MFQKRLFPDKPITDLQPMDKLTQKGIDDLKKKI